jgi:hypothetical protein
MAWKDFVTGPTNKIIVGSTSAVGIIIAGAVGVSLLTPAYQVKDSNGQVTWEATLGGSTRQSGSLVTRGIIASRTLSNCNTIDGTSTGMLVCGTDTSGGGVDTGAILNAGNSRFVNVSGDSMTGNLIINTGLAGNALQVVGSGSVSGNLTASTGIFGGDGGVYNYAVGAGNGTLGFNSNAYVAGVNGYGALMQMNPSTGTFTMFLESNVSAGAPHGHTTTLSWDTTGIVTMPVGIKTSGTISGALLTQNGAGNNYFLGNLGVGTTTPAAKFQVHTAAGANPTFRFSDGDVDHGMTALPFNPAPTTDTIGQVQVFSSAAGGLYFLGLSKGNLTALGFEGIVGTGSSITTTAILFRGSKRNGTTKQALAANEILTQFQTSAGTALISIMGNGRMGLGTATPNAKLQVVGSGSFTSTISGAGLNIQGVRSYILGNTGIGTTTPKGRLHVVGSGTFIGTLSGSSTFTLSPMAAAASVNHGTCWKTAGVIGYCSTALDASGGCTCN